MKELNLDVAKNYVQQGHEKLLKGKKNHQSSRKVGKYNSRKCVA